MRVPLSLRLQTVAGRFLPFLRPRVPDREMVFRLRPIRNSAIEWQMGDGGEATLHVPHRDDRIGRALALWFRLPKDRPVELDEVGSFVWSLCDGEHTVEGIVAQTSRRFKLNRREVEVSVTTYLQMLGERRYIGFYERGSKGI